MKNNVTKDSSAIVHRNVIVRMENAVLKQASASVQLDGKV